MLQYPTVKQKFSILFLVFILTGIAGHSQVERQKPIWWFGASTAANFNFYRGTTQMLNNTVYVPTAFHKGKGVRPYISLLTEYRPNKVLGGMLNLAYDNRGGKFDGVLATCDCPATLSTNISYLAIEPSLRLAPFSSSFYVFAGPTLNFNLSKSFTYTQEKQEDKKGDWSDIRKTAISAQFGAGIDIPISAPGNPKQMSLSPFVSFQTDLGHQPRSTESWSFYTARAGVAFKFGKRKTAAAKKIVDAETVLAPETTVKIVEEKVVQFSVRGPIQIPPNRKVKETFPLRNSVFFDLGSTEIPNRYVKLSESKASSFKEEQLQESQPANLNNGRSSRQLTVYHNILNIIGDRMRSNTQSSITLTGASTGNAAEGKMMAESTRQYLVTIFGIDASRITTVGRDKPLIPSEQPGGTKELTLLREGDRRVDISSTSAELLLQVGGREAFLKPVQINAAREDPLDSHVLFMVADADKQLRSWTVEVTGEKGNVQHYGPYTQNQASVPGKTILGNSEEGTYKILMLGQTISGLPVKKEITISFSKTKDPKQEGLRYSILFDFDKSKSIATYEKFLIDIVTPLIPENATVIIHGHTDIIGDEKHNLLLSNERAMGAQQILERGLSNAGIKGVKFETVGFGKDATMSPFENGFPEERFYNRTVIIDIIPVK